MPASSTFTIQSADFMTSIADISVYKEVSQTYPCGEVCVVGRSNVGKSSFINMLAQRNKLAKTSSTPGLTRLLNLFDFNKQTFVLVDLPGYGYAKAQKTKIAEWGKLIENYFNTTQKLNHVFALVDIRHPPSVLDKQMIQYLYHHAIPFTVIATKLDKIKKPQVSKHIQILATELGLGKDNIIACSAETKDGRDKVLNRIGELLESFSIQKNTGEESYE